jgi:hypothetical protein
MVRYFYTRCLVLPHLVFLGLCDVSPSSAVVSIRPHVLVLLHDSEYHCGSHTREHGQIGINLLSRSGMVGVEVKETRTRCRGRRVVLPFECRASCDEWISMSST